MYNSRTVAYRSSNRGWAFSSIVLAAMVTFVDGTHAVEDYHRKDADRLAIQVLTDVNAEPAACSADILDRFRVHVIHCGEIGVTRRSDARRIGDEIDEFFLTRRFDAHEDDWVRVDKMLSRSYEVDDYSMTVVLSWKSNVVAVVYHMDLGTCLPLRDLRKADDDGVTAPKQIKESKVEPVYPESARLWKVEATLIFEGIIHTSGRLTDLCVLWTNPAYPEFEQAAREALEQWRYEPAMYDGAPIDIRLTISIAFRLK